MSSVVISGDTSGAITLAASAVAGTNTITLPSATGNAVVDSATQTLTSKTLTSPTITGAVVSSMASSVITSGTAQNSTSGTSIDFTSIPSWVKRITVMFNGVSTSGSSNYLVQVGSGSVTTTGYLSAYFQASGTNSVANSTVGFQINNGTGAGNIEHGHVVITQVSGNNWTASGTLGESDTTRMQFLAGSIALGGTLDRVRITTVNGTDTFDAGSINILYE